MGISLVTAPTAEPVTLEEIQAYCRISGNAENTKLTALAQAAREYIEEYTGLQLIDATYDESFAGFANEMSLSKFPLKSVTSITYTDDDSQAQTLATSVYDVISNVNPGVINLAYGQDFPDTEGGNDDVVVQYVAGYTLVPEALKLAIKQLTLHWYDNPELAIVGQNVTPMPFAVTALLNQYRIMRLY